MPARQRVATRNIRRPFAGARFDIPVTLLIMTSTLTVDLGERSYGIVIGRALLDGNFDLAPYLRSADCLVVSNETVAPLYLDRLLPNLDGCKVSSICIPDGESFP